MTWQVFGGEAQELYLALLQERCERDGLGTADDVLARQFRLHLHRGIGYLAAPHATRSVADLVRLAVPAGDAPGGRAPPGNEPALPQAPLLPFRPLVKGDRMTGANALSGGLMFAPMIRGFVSCALIEPSWQPPAPIGHCSSLRRPG